VALNPWTKAGAYMGLAFIVPAGGWLGYYLGSTLDAKYGTSYWQLVGIIFGLGAGLYETLRQAQRIEKK
jgi:F0F1-type ATP synthase assembly protein I